MVTIMTYFVRAEMQFSHFFPLFSATNDPNDYRLNPDEEERERFLKLSHRIDTNKCLEAHIT